MVAVESSVHVRYAHEYLGGEGRFFHDAHVPRHSPGYALMVAPRVFISMIFALIVFAVVTYLLSGSAWTTAWQTLICAVLLQVGYFVAVMAKVAKEARDREQQMQRQTRPLSQASDEKDAKAIHVTNRPGQFNS